MNRAEKIARRTEVLENTFTSFSEEKRKKAICRQNDWNFKQAIFKLASARINRRYKTQRQPEKSIGEILKEREAERKRNYAVKKFAQEMLSRKIKLGKKLKKIKRKPMPYLQYLAQTRIY